MSDARWLPVVGFEGLYEVSDRGRVRSLDRVIEHADGRRVPYRGRVLALKVGKRGYSVVDLRGSTRSVHHLVLEAFVGPRPAGLEACHDDGDRLNNSLGNLRWDTRSANNFDRVRHGTHPNAAKTECPRGHSLVEPNLVRSSIAEGFRRCLSCNRARAAVRKRPSLVFEVVADDKYAAIMGRTEGGRGEIVRGHGRGTAGRA